jgi:predicted DNA-binding protein YlxM (UPF0122 family)
MSDERRKDVGMKTMYVILTALITLLLSIFFNKTYDQSVSAMTLGNENKKDIAVIQECIKSVNSSLNKMDEKLDLLVGWRK